MSSKITAAIIVAGLSLATFCSPVHADPAADALLKKVTKAMAAVHSASGIVTTSYSLGLSGSAAPPNLVGEFKFLKPNMLREDDWTFEKIGSNSLLDYSAPHYIFASNGVKYWFITPNGSISTGKVDPAGKTLSNINTNIDGIPISTMFFGPELVKDFAKGSEASIGKDQVWNGLKYQVIQLSMGQTAGSSAQTDQVSKVHGEMYIGSDLLVHRFVVDAGNLGQIEIAFINVHTGVHFAKRDFRFKLPHWAKLASSK